MHLRPFAESDTAAEGTVLIGKRLIPDD